MKSKKKRELLIETFENLKKLFSADKGLVDVFSILGSMTTTFIDKLINRKKKYKQDAKETSEKLRGELQTLETQLFTTKVETETLKIDKKYFEDQVNEL
jgi:hypothetical protein